VADITISDSFHGSSRQDHDSSGDSVVTKTGDVFLELENVDSTVPHEILLVSKTYRTGIGYDASGEKFTLKCGVPVLFGPLNPNRFSDDMASPDMIEYESNRPVKVRAFRG
jgi:hypothetical protein